MELVKKNLVSVILGVIAIICVVLIFYPLGSEYAKMTAEVAASKKVGDELSKLQGEKRYWPTLSPKEEDRQELTSFPTDALIAAGSKITEEWKTTTASFFETVVRRQDSALKPLIPGLLPRANGQALPLRFKDLYAALMNLDSNAPTPGGGAPASGGFGGGGFGGGGFGSTPKPAGSAAVVSGPPKPVLGTPLVGRMPPADDEIKSKADEREATIRLQKNIVVNGAVTNQPAVDQMVAVERAAVGDRVRDEVARQSMIYVDVTPGVAFLVQDHIVGTEVPTDDNIFLAQTGLWLQQEICRSLYEINKPIVEAKHTGVIDAPVKHLLGVRFTLPYAPPAAAAAGTPAPTDVPVLPATPPAAKIAVDFVKNPLGHTSNDLYDVLPFTIALICDAETLPQTIAGLGKDRYLTVRSVDVQTVDSAVASARGLIYGAKPVVQVTIHGQYLMLRKFVGPYMPANIIRGVLTPAPAAGAPAAG